MKKRALTLLEVMIVIFLITLITGTIGYSMKGTLEKGRDFRTEQGKEQLRDLLLIAVASGKTPDEVLKDPLMALKQLGLAKDPKNLLLDGWKQPFEIRLSPARNDFIINSEAQVLYRHRTGGSRPAPTTNEEE